MTDASWNFKDVDKDPVGSADDIVICSRHPFPKDLQPLSSPTKGSDFLSLVSLNSKNNVFRAYHDRILKRHTNGSTAYPV